MAGASPIEGQAPFELREGFHERPEYERDLDVIYARRVIGVPPARSPLVELPQWH